MAAADCTTPSLFDPVNGDFFYQVNWVRRLPGKRWLYDIEYEGATGLRRRIVYVLQEWTMAKTIAAPTLEYDSGYQCAVLVDVPKAKGSDRPYYVPPSRAERAAYDSALALENGILWPIGILFALLLVPAWFGFEGDSGWGGALAAAGAIIFFGAIVAWFFIGFPWQNFQAAHAYWAWFDGLPRQDGLLCPLTTDDFTVLLRGPPSYTTIDANTWVIITALMAVAWLAVLAPAVVVGCYWLLTPLPLQQVHERALAQDRAPTVEELDAALYAALAGKRPWQIRVMRRKAEAFMRRFTVVPSRW